MTRSVAINTEHCAWWDPANEDPGPALWKHLASVENKQYSHHQQLLFNALKYSNREISAFDWGWGRLTHTSLLPHREGTDDVIRPVVEAKVAAIGKNKVKARPKTKRASFKLRRASRKLDRALYAEAKRLDFWEKHKQAYTDSCWGEVGVLFWDFSTDENDPGPICERVFPDELIVDNDECYATPEPLTVGRRRAVHVDSVISAWDLDEQQAEKLKEEAKRASDLGWVHERAPGPGWVVVVEAHRRAVGKTPGRHVVGTLSMTLLDEAWDEDYFPYTFYHNTKPVSGFYCRSEVELAWPWQRRLDKLNRDIEDAQDLACRMRIWAPLGGKINVSDLTNRMGRVIQSAIKPETLSWDTNVAELYQERRYIKEECLADRGITQLSAQGKLPDQARLDSSKALNEYNQIQDDRLVDESQRYERFQLQGYEMIVRMYERAHTAGYKFKSTWVAGKRVEEIDWDDIDYSRDRFVLQIEPSSTFNESMAAHFDDTAKLVQAGLVTPEEFLSLQSTPDTEKLLSLRLAGIENIYHTIEQIEEGKYVPPSPLQDLVTGIQLVHFHYLDLCSEYDDVPDKVKNMLVLWIMQAKWIADQGAEYSEQGSAGTDAASQMIPGVTAPMPQAVPTDPMQMPAMPQMPGLTVPTTPSMAPNATQL